MRHLFTLVKASLLALLPFLLATAKSATFGPCLATSFTTPCLAELLNPLNAAVTTFFGYEALSRVIPTQTDVSAVNFLARLVDAFLKNNATGYVSGQLATHGLVS